MGGRLGGVPPSRHRRPRGHCSRVLAPPRHELFFAVCADLPESGHPTAVHARLSRSLHSRSRAAGDEPPATNSSPFPVAATLQLIHCSSRGHLTLTPSGNVRSNSPEAPLSADAVPAPGHPSRTKDLHHVAPRPRRGIQPLLSPSPSRSQPRSPSPPSTQRTASHSCPAPRRRVARIPLHALRHGQAREQRFDV